MLQLEDPVVVRRWDAQHPRHLALEVAGVLHLFNDRKVYHPSPVIDGGASLVVVRLCGVETNPEPAVPSQPNRLAGTTAIGRLVDLLDVVAGHFILSELEHDSVIAGVPAQPHVL
jgi:hypothetical protein